MDADPSTAPRYIARSGSSLFGTSRTIIGTDPALIEQAAAGERRRGRIELAILLALAVVLLAVLLVPGLLLWLPSRDEVGSRANLGASLLGGAVVAFSVMAVELLALWRIHRTEDANQRRADRAALQLQLSLQEDFSGVDLSGRDLSSFYLRRKELAGARLVGADLRTADLSYGLLPDANLAGAQLDHAQLRGVDLSRGTLTRVEGWSADLTSANLEGARLDGAQLPLSTLTNANLRNADLSGANLNSCDLSGANLDGAQLEGAQLSTLIGYEGTIWPAGFDLDDRGVSRIDPKWARLIRSRSSTRIQWSAEYDGEGRIVKLDVHD